MSSTEANVSEVNTVHDCFGGKSDYTKQSLKELNAQMKSFDFAKLSKKTRIRHKIEYDEFTDPIEEDDDIVAVGMPSEREEKHSVKKSSSARPTKLAVKRPRISEAQEDETINPMKLIDSLQKRIENMKLRINKQSLALDKADTDLYLQKLALSTKAVELEDAKTNHDKFVSYHNQKVANLNSTIKSYKIYMFGIVVSAVAIVINSITYAMSSDLNSILSGVTLVSTDKSMVCLSKNE